jgi:Flp pilus assembly pilin Flp
MVDDAATTRPSTEVELVLELSYMLRARLASFAFRFRSDRGAGLVEYSLLVAAIALVCFVAVQTFGGNVGTMVDDSGGSIGAATP